MNTADLTDKRNLLVNSLLAVPACQRPDGDLDWFPAVDLTETQQEYVFEVDLPGLKPEAIQLSVESDSLSIRGQRVPKAPGGRPLRVERPAGAFVRHLPLPPDAGGDIQATFSEGVLELRVPKVCPGPESGPAQPVVRQPEEALP